MPDLDLQQAPSTSRNSILARMARVSAVAPSAPFGCLSTQIDRVTVDNELCHPRPYMVAGYLHAPSPEYSRMDVDRGNACKKIIRMQNSKGLFR